jgi:tight adherence protein B
MIGKPWLTLLTTFTVWCYAARVGKANAATGAGEAVTSFWESGAAMIVVGLVAAVLIGMALSLLLRPRAQTVRDRLAPFVSPAAPGEEGDDLRGSPLFAAVERALSDYGWWGKIEVRLELAGIPLGVSRLVAYGAVATVLAVLAAVALAGSPILAIFGGLIPVAIHLWIGRSLRKRQVAFAEQLADNLQVLASSMRGGQSMAGGLAIVAQEAAEPARHEFKLIVAEERLGVPLDEAVRIVARRMESRDMEQVALVAAIQRDAGGNTADVLDRVVETIRERMELRRMVKTLTAQGRISRNVMTALPGLLLLAISAMNPEYAEPLLHSTGGQMMLGVAVGLVALGYWVISRIVNIKV